MIKQHLMRAFERGAWRDHMPSIELERALVGFSMNRRIVLVFSEVCQGLELQYVRRRSDVMRP